MSRPGLALAQATYRELLAHSISATTYLRIDWPSAVARIIINPRLAFVHWAVRPQQFCAAADEVAAIKTRSPAIGAPGARKTDSDLQCKRFEVSHLHSRTMVLVWCRSSRLRILPEGQPWGKDVRLASFGESARCNEGMCSASRSHS